ncbi:hypothetical protein [Actinoplanes auranticolor]|uniref:Uncharacterized protein n=1 Tax=Actinoplanes auranticolor TaxID=47988 RepID=A0A919VWH0_9ACTN|nr:hypothetical protein [Actinoplanes auranticolor]GIM77620.1 hypothetical protein Aau02nite_76860 [Actinoplanes auranticolor]
MDDAIEVRNGLTTKVNPQLATTFPDGSVEVVQLWFDTEPLWEHTAQVLPCLINVRAAVKVIPRNLGPGDISAAFGAPFIDDAYVQQLLQRPCTIPACASSIPAAPRAAPRRAGRFTRGSAGMAAPDLAQRLLTETPIRVLYEVGEGKRAVDVEATAAAQVKAAELEERCAAWVWEVGISNTDQRESPA